MTQTFSVGDEVDVWWRNKWWAGGRLVAINNDKTASVVFGRNTYGSRWATKSRYKLDYIRLPYR